MSLDLLLDAGLAGLSAVCMTILLTAPFRFAGAALACGAAGRLVRDLLLAWQVSSNLSTLTASTTVVLLAVALVHRRGIPVVVITGILPLGASVAMFETLVQILRLPSRTGEDAAQTAMALVTSLSRVVSTSMAIATGLALGITVGRMLLRGRRHAI